MWAKGRSAKPNSCFVSFYVTRHQSSIGRTILSPSKDSVTLQRICGEIKHGNLQNVDLH